MYLKLWPLQSYLLISSFSAKYSFLLVNYQSKTLILITKIHFINMLAVVIDFTTITMAGVSRSLRRPKERTLMSLLFIFRSWPLRSCWQSLDKNTPNQHGFERWIVSFSPAIGVIPFQRFAWFSLSVENLTWNIL